MVLNDEAHHLWDPGSAWNEAIDYINSTLQKKYGDEGGIVTQLDLSATPKDDKGQFFQHIICDFPLGEAVDAGIVKTPIIGKASNLKEEPGDDAAIKYRRHLLLGYERWKASWEEWRKSGKKALMFVMTENTKAADQITREFNRSELFKELNGRTINLHTNLKGKLKKVGRGQSARYEFVESEKEISDDDLDRLRRLSRELDSDPQHYCIVSVLMLREGWDVRNVTTIVPLRAYTSKAAILPEQTLGRGLRRMAQPGEVDEILTVVEHPAFASLYQQELAQEGLELGVVDVERVPRTTVTIYPDPQKPNFKDLEIEIPQLTQEFRQVAKLEGLALDDVKNQFQKMGLKPLRLGEKTTAEIDYEGRTLLTDEIVQQMKILIPLLQNGFGAVSYYREQLERMCSIRGSHAVLAPLLQSYLEDILFGPGQSLADAQLASRMGDADVQEHIRAVFVPLIRNRVIRREVRTPAAEPVRLSNWKPFQASSSETRPTETSPRTLFNLIPCNRELELAFARFATNARDVAAFAKNAGPQAQRIDYLAGGSRLAFYTPDFFVRTEAGKCYLVEVKGRVDKDVPAKARAAVAWCKAATRAGTAWEYVYVPQAIFEALASDKFEDLVSQCRPALGDLVVEDIVAQPSLFARVDEATDLRLEEFIPSGEFSSLPSRHQKAIQHAVMLYRLHEKKEGLPFSPVFQPLLGPLENSAESVLLNRLGNFVPVERAKQRAFFEPEWSQVPGGKRKYYSSEIKKLERTLVFRSSISALGHLKFALEVGQKKAYKGGVFDAINEAFGAEADAKLLEYLAPMYEFRNKYIAHQEKQHVDKELARSQLREWSHVFVALRKAGEK